MKKFKRAVIVGACSVMLAMSLTGCKQTADCSICGKEQVPCTVKELGGEKIYYCEDCEKAMEALGDLLN